MTLCPSPTSQDMNGIEMLYGDGHRATVEFVRHFDKFFDCLNVRSMTEGFKKRKPNLLPYRSPNDERLTWLETDFLNYLQNWDERVEAREHISKQNKNRMKLSRETLEGLRMTVKSCVDLSRYLLGRPGVHCVLSEKFNQDPLESYFGNQRQMRGGNEAPSVLQFCQNANALRLKSSHLLAVRGANVTTYADALIDGTALPRRSYTDRNNRGHI
ncbi:uncharacterized protein [Ptychodera flava]|uniref:uncharacterized protein n=1 Tax=Ptychodera flava TaxID=63121 RepID=UPI00396A3BD6